MKTPPEVLRLSGDSSATLAATMIFKKRSATIDYDRRKISEKIPRENFSKSGRKIGGFSGLGIVAMGEPCRPGSCPDGADRAKIPDVVQLATPGKRPAWGLYRP